MDEIPAKLAYYALDDGRVQLAWDMVVRTKDHWWNLWVDAASGEVLAKSGLANKLRCVSGSEKHMCFVLTASYSLPGTSVKQ